MAEIGNPASLGETGNNDGAPTAPSRPVATGTFDEAFGPVADNTHITLLRKKMTAAFELRDEARRYRRPNESISDVFEALLQRIAESRYKD